ncbi:hypothetical protein L596_000276 [Steinernema carpocapsae]|uniref:Uncharacterized protein n=1 Tax=Steinernema carpocapsae TaxID=34508 RepID=A0A4U8UHN1_STECR|nr:hypothetical protein L596_000276 [Steinernema carpocapsae]
MNNNKVPSLLLRGHEIALRDIGWQRLLFEAEQDLGIPQHRRPDSEINLDHIPSLQPKPSVDVQDCLKRMQQVCLVNTFSQSQPKKKQ